MPQQIHLESQDAPYATVKRKLGVQNAGMYCTNCSEFFAVAVSPPGVIKDAEFVSDGPLRFVCPLCETLQSRDPTEIFSLVLTEATKRRPPIPKTAH